jgi:hypothetical protein
MRLGVKVVKRPEVVERSGCCGEEGPSLGFKRSKRTMVELGVWFQVGLVDVDECVVRESFGGNGNEANNDWIKRWDEDVETMGGVGSRSRQRSVQDVTLDQIWRRLLMDI